MEVDKGGEPGGGVEGAVSRFQLASHPCYQDMAEVLACRTEDRMLFIRVPSYKWRHRISPTQG